MSPISPHPPNKDRITCHVLNTLTGRPATNLPIILSGPGSGTAGPPAVFESRTDADGRVASWLPFTPPNQAGEVAVYTLEDVLGEVEGEGDANADAAGASSGVGTGGVAGAASSGTVGDGVEKKGKAERWTLKFDTSTYWGGEEKTFYPEVSVTFFVAPGERYHVPLLLSPYGYTTYRGT